MKNIKRLALILLTIAAVLLIVATVNNFNSNASTATPDITATEQDYITNLQSEDATIRSEAALGLTGASSDEATTALLGNLADTDETAGYNTAIALASSSNPNVANALVAELKNPDVVVRQRAMIALREMKTEVAVPVLSEALDDGATSMYAAMALVNMDSVDAHNLVLTALADEEMTGRRQAVMAAIEQADPVTSQYLLGRALSSDNLILRRNAIQLRDFMSHTGS